jgi:PAS domain S-box-containing protein
MPEIDPIRVLVIEDNLADAVLLQKLLESAGPARYCLTVAASLAEARAALGRQAFDIALLDLGLPDAQALGALQQLQAAAPALPIIVGTGTDDEALALAAVERGAQDYMVKGRFDRALLDRAIRYAIGRQRAEMALHESQERLRLAAIISGFGSYAYDFATGQGYWSPELKALFGLGPDEPLLLDADLVPLAVHPDDRPTFLAAVAAANDPCGNGALTLEYRILRPEGSVRWLRIHGMTTFAGQGARGRPIRAVGAAIDITEERRAQQALRESERVTRALIDATDDVALLMAPDGTVLVGNQSLSRALGHDLAALVGHSVFDFLPPAVAASRMKHVHEAVATGRPVSFVDRREGRWIDLHVYPILDDQGRVVQLAVYARDITDRVTAEEALRRSEEQYRILFESMREGCGYHRMVFDDQRRPVDWIYLAVNKAFMPMTGMADVVGKRVSQVLPTLRETNPELFEFYGSVAATGRPGEMETYVPPLKTWYRISAFRPAPDHFGVVFEDITARKQAERRLDLTVQVLKILNGPGPMPEQLCQVLTAIREALEVEGAAFRLHQGDDFPYVQAEGLPPVFLAQENSLLRKDASGAIAVDAQGRPLLECACGLVTLGRTDPALPYFSSGGSFWTNSTTLLLAQLAAPPGELGLRNRCHEAGYESVALIPLRTQDAIVGLLHLVDRRRDQFSPETIRFLEGLGASLGTALHRTQLLEVVQASEGRYRTLFENMLEGCAYCRMIFDDQRRPVDWTYLAVNKAFGPQTGLADVVGKRVSEIIPGLRESNPELFEFYGRVATTGQSGEREIFVAPLKVWLHISAFQPAPDHFVAVFENISDRKLAEERMAAYQRYLRALGRKLATVEDNERRRIAADLHDDVVQSLAAAQLRLQMVDPAALPPPAAASLTEALRLVQAAVHDTRSLMFDISPPPLYELGLEAAVEWLAEKFGRENSLAVSVDADPKPIPLATETRGILFRAIRELLVNVVKHARAQRAEVAIHCEDGGVRVEVADDGCGFDREKAQAARSTLGGFGLFEVRERLDYIGGSLQIESPAAGGTRAILRVPLPPPPRTGGA